jgi:hypothetical protein
VLGWTQKRQGRRLSERARGAFPAMTVTSVPAQTIVVGELAQPAGLGDLPTLCMAMGLEVVSVRRLPGETATRPGAAAADPAAARPRGMNDEHAADPARPHRRLRCG